MTQLKVSGLLCFLLLGAWEAQGQPTQLPVPPAPPSATRVVVGHLIQGLYDNDAGPPDDASMAVDVAFKTPPKRSADPDAYRRFVRDTLVTTLRQKGWTGENVSGSNRHEFVIRVLLSLDTKVNLMLAQARLIRMPSGIWERLRKPQGTQRSNAAAEAPIDLEIRSILGMRTAGFPQKNTLYVRGSKLHHKSLVASPVLAIRIRDYNDDRVPEVAFLQRNSLQVGRYRERSFKDVVARVDLRTLARPSSAKLRDPIGSLVHVTESDGRTILVAASSDYEEPVAFRVTRDDKLHSVPIRVGGGAWPLYSLGVNGLAGLDWPQSTDVLSGPINELDLKTGSAMMSQGTLDGAYRVDVFPHWSLEPGALVSRERRHTDALSRVSWRPQVAGVSSGYRIVVNHAQEGHTLREQHGTVFCMADLNLDGEPEILTTSTSLEGDDTLTLYTKREVGYVPIDSVRLSKENVRGRVTALTYGDIDRDGRSEFLLASTDGSRNYLGLVEVKLTL